MAPIRTPLKTELGLAAAVAAPSARRGKSEAAASVAAVPRKERRVGRDGVGMGMELLWRRRTLRLEAAEQARLHFRPWRASERIRPIARVFLIQDSAVPVGNRNRIFAGGDFVPKILHEL